MEIVLPIAIALIVSLLAPAVSDWLKGRREVVQRDQEAQLRREEKEQDWARQDAVAAAARAAVDDAARTAAAAAKLLLQANARVEANASQATAERVNIDAKLNEVIGGNKEIHTLVNSNLTSANEDTLVAYELVLSFLEREHQREPTATTAAAVDAMRHKVAGLQANVTQRLEQTEQAAARRTGG